MVYSVQKTVQYSRMQIMIERKRLQKSMLIPRKICDFFIDYTILCSIASLLLCFVPCFVPSAFFKYNFQTLLQKQYLM